MLSFEFQGAGDQIGAPLSDNADMFGAFYSSGIRFCMNLRQLNSTLAWLPVKFCAYHTRIALAIQGTFRSKIW